MQHIRDYYYFFKSKLDGFIGEDKEFRNFIYKCIQLFLLFLLLTIYTCNESGYVEAEHFDNRVSRIDSQLNSTSMEIINLRRDYRKMDEDLNYSLDSISKQIYESQFFILKEEQKGDNDKNYTWD